MAKNSRFLVTCGNDTTINVWTLKGALLSSINTRQMQNYMACISPDSTMISAAAHMSDVRIWKFRTSKEGDMLGVEEKAFTYLRGHTSFIFWIAFTSDSKKILTVSKDNTWKLWDLDVNYNLEELPKVLMSTRFPDNAVYTRVEISWDDNYFIALTNNSCIHLWNLISGEMLDTIQNSAEITDMRWFPKEHKFAISGADGTIKIFDIHHTTQ
jgi:WD40 repeat protein